MIPGIARFILNYGMNSILSVVSGYQLRILIFKFVIFHCIWLDKKNKLENFILKKEFFKMNGNKKDSIK